MNDVYVGQNV